ncbi:MAG: DUF4157 domain-containing protein [Lysobacter sp.]|nr:DUF4157 domain-containing protein [Lysobacter sp.]
MADAAAKSKKDKGHKAKAREQRRPLRSAAPTAIPVEMRRALPSGNGQPLPPMIAAHIGDRFGADFSHVRLHTDAQAAQAAEDLGAKAYTIGSNVVFADGRFQHGSHEGQRLLAHELAHVMQQTRGGAAQSSFDGTGPLEQAADRAASQAIQGGGTIEVGGASAPAPMCDPDDDKRRKQQRLRRDDDAGNDVSPRQEEKDKTQQRKQERATAGKQESQLTKAQAEQELRALENSYKQPGATKRSPKRKTEDLKRYQKLLKLASGSQLEKNQRQGAFDELQRTPATTAGKPQTKHVAGGPQLKGQELRAGKDHYAQPDYSLYRRKADGTLERVHVNLKSDQIDMQTPAKARATARTYVNQAIKNSRHLANGESIIISFARTPSKEVQEGMKREFFAEGSPVSEVRYGTTTHKRADYKPPAAPAPAAPKAKSSGSTGKKKAPGKKPAAKPIVAIPKPGPPAAGKKANTAPKVTKSKSAPSKVAPPQPKTAPTAKATPPQIPVQKAPAARIPPAKVPAQQTAPNKPAPPPTAPSTAKPGATRPTAPAAAAPQRPSAPAKVATPPITAKTVPPQTPKTRAPTTAGTRVADTQVPSAPPPSAGAAKMQAAAGALQLAGQGLAALGNYVQGNAAEDAYQRMLLSIQALQNSTDEGVWVHFVYSQQDPHGDSAINPVAVFSHIETQVGSRDNKRTPAVLTAGGSSARVTSMWLPPGQRSLKSELNELWRRLKVMQTWGERETKRTFVSRFLFERKGDSLDIAPIYDARAHLASARIALEEKRPEDAEASMKAADALLDQMMERFEAYAGKKF